MVTLFQWDLKVNSAEHTVKYTSIRKQNRIVFFQAKSVSIPSFPLISLSKEHRLSWSSNELRTYSPGWISVFSDRYTSLFILPIDKNQQSESPRLFSCSSAHFRVLFIICITHQCHRCYHSDEKFGCQWLSMGFVIVAGRFYFESSNFIGHVCTLISLRQFKSVVQRLICGFNFSSVAFIRVLESNWSAFCLRSASYTLNRQANTLTMRWYAVYFSLQEFPSISFEWILKFKLIQPNRGCRSVL